MLVNLTQNRVMLTASHLVMVHIIIVIVIVNLLLALLLIWCSTTRQENCLPSAAVRVREKHVVPLSAVHDLGILIDSDIIVTLRSHMFCTMSGCVCAMLQQLCSIRRSVSFVPFTDHAGNATLRLPQCNTCWASGLSASSTCARDHQAVVLSCPT